MNILFQTKNIHISKDDEDFIARRLENLGKFFSPDTKIFVDIENKRGGQFNTEVCYVSLRVQNGHYQYFTDEYQENLRKSFDHAFGDLFRMIRNERSRSRRMLKSASRGFKKVFKNKFK